MGRRRESIEALARDGFGPLIEVTGYLISESPRKRHRTLATVRHVGGGTEEEVRPSPASDRLLRFPGEQKDVVASLEWCFLPERRGITRQPGVVSHMEVELVDDYTISVKFPEPGTAAL